MASSPETTPQQRRRRPKRRRYLAGMAWWVAHSWRWRAANGFRLRSFQ